MIERPLATRAALATAMAAAIWAAVVAGFGGFEVRAGPVSLRSHRLLPPVLLLAAATIAALRRGPRHAGAELRRWNALLPRTATACAAAAAAATLLVAVRWGTNAAGGSDSYCYLSQARLLASGAVHVEQPWAGSLPWPDADLASVPAGYVAVSGTPGTIAPMCPAGLALIMAAFFRVGGEAAMLTVVPLMGAATVWLTYLLGRLAASRGVAASAAMLVAASPIFLYQVVQPMSDVPAACLWTAAMVLACRSETARGAALSGLASAAAIVIRPNLAPIAAVVGAWIALDAMKRDAADRVRRAMVTAFAYAAGLAPGIASVAILQHAMYGSALRSGYAGLGELFRWEHAGPNLRRFPAWLALSQSPIVAVGAAAPLVRDEPARTRRRWLLLAVFGANSACYLLYTPFDDWWYLRFLLPGIPCLMVLTVIVLRTLLERLPDVIRPIAAVAALSAWILASVHVAATHKAFALRESEARFVETGAYLARALPPDAMVLAAFQSGSIRYY
jgi:hypothetical protein